MPDIAGPALVLAAGLRGVAPAAPEEECLGPVVAPMVETLTKLGKE